VPAQAHRSNETPAQEKLMAGRFRLAWDLAQGLEEEL